MTKFLLYLTERGYIPDFLIKRATLFLSNRRLVESDIEKNKEDLLRSWTELDTFSNKKIYNALHIRQPHKIAIIEKC